jgi:MFS superfamily sulfate permease-like transporter
LENFDLFQHLILDMSTVSYIDQSAAKAFKDWLKKDTNLYKKCLVNCCSKNQSKFCKLILPEQNNKIAGWADSLSIDFEQSGFTFFVDVQK